MLDSYCGDPKFNPGTDQPDCGYFHCFPQSLRQMLGWIFITIHGRLAR